MTTTGEHQRWHLRLILVLSTIGIGMSMICTLVAWSAFGWRDAILTLIAVISGFFWAFALTELMRIEADR